MIVFYGKAYYNFIKDYMQNNKIHQERNGVYKWESGCFGMKMKIT